MTTQTVTVYTTPACVACTLTKRHLDRRAISFTEIAIDDNIREACVYLGFTAAPVVFAATSTGEVSWAGYRPDRIDALAVVA